jgi:cytochrome b561
VADHLHKPLGIAFVQVAAALYHGLIRRDGVLQSMARGAGKN